MTKKVDEAPFKFTSDDQLTYVATCIAASNLGFDPLDNTWWGADKCRKWIKEADDYRGKTQAIIHSVSALSDDECDLYNGLLDETKGWKKSIKKEGYFNKLVHQYLELGQPE